MLKNEADTIQLIQNDTWMMNILKEAQSLNLPDWWICAGFVRSKIWDTLHGFKERTPIPDIDVIYFDDNDLNEKEEKKAEAVLKLKMPDVPWSVKNQARMHLVNGFAPYTSSIDAISKFPETATALGVKLDQKGQVILTAPYGIHDVLHLEIRPTENFKEGEYRKIYEKRVRKKEWKTTWSKIVVHI